MLPECFSLQVDLTSPEYQVVLPRSTLQSSGGREVPQTNVGHQVGGLQQEAGEGQLVSVILLVYVGQDHVTLVLGNSENWNRNSLQHFCELLFSYVISSAEPR